jgi:hypothetical protein
MSHQFLLKNNWRSCRILDECTSSALESHSVTAAELYRAFQSWATENGEFVLTKTMVGKELRKTIVSHPIISHRTPVDAWRSSHLRAGSPRSEREARG